MVAGTAALVCTLCFSLKTPLGHTKKEKKLKLGLFGIVNRDVFAACCYAKHPSPFPSYQCHAFPVKVVYWIGKIQFLIDAGRVLLGCLAWLYCSTEQSACWCRSRGDQGTYCNFSRIFLKQVPFNWKACLCRVRSSSWMTSAAGNPFTHPIVSLSHCTKCSAG